MKLYTIHELMQLFNDCHSHAECERLIEYVNTNKEHYEPKLMRVMQVSLTIISCAFYTVENLKKER